MQSHHYVEVQPGITLHYVGFNLDAHDRPLLVLLHGFPEFWQAWEQVIPLVGHQYRIVAPDLRGFNLSSKPPDVRAYAVKHLVGDIVGLIAAVQAGGGKNAQVTLAAHDWGGAVAYNMAAARSDCISQLIIVNSPHPLTFWHALRHDSAQQEASQYMNWLRKPGCEVALAENQFARLEGFFLKMGDAAWFTPQLRAQYHEAWSQPGAITGGCNYYRASPLHPPTEQEPGPLGIELDVQQFFISVPTLLIWGEADIALLPVLLDGIEAHFANLTIVRHPNQSHWILHEAPEAVANSMLTWGKQKATQS
jgi:epoxide hydrolase 4